MESGQLVVSEEERDDSRSASNQYGLSCLCSCAACTISRSLALVILSR